MTVVEAIEREFLRRKDESAEEGKTFLSSTFPLFDRLLTYATSPEDISLVQHHKAKALRRCGDEAGAETLFREVLASSFPLDQSRLQLARILERRNDADSAAALIKQILDHARADHESVSTTILLEVFGTLRHRSLKSYRDAFAKEYSDIALEQIVKTIASGFEQPYFAVASLASYWAEHAPQQFLDLFRLLPPAPPALLRDDSGKAAMAEIYIHAAGLIQISDAGLADRLRQDALDGLTNFVHLNSFYVHLRVRALIGMQRYAEALTELEAVSGDTNVWHYVWKACVEDGLGKAAESQVLVAEATRLAREQNVRLWMVESGCRKIFDIP